MKQIMKKAVNRLTAALNRLGEDFDMLLLEDILPYSSDVTGSDSFDDELLV